MELRERIRRTVHEIRAPQAGAWFVFSGVLASIVAAAACDSALHIIIFYQVREAHG